MGKVKTMKKKSILNISKVKKDANKTKMKKDIIEPKNIKLILKEKPGQIRERQSEIKVDLKHVRVALEGLFKLTKENVSKKLLDNEYPIFVQVSLIKIPECPARIVRLPLKNSLLMDTSEVALIVPDLQKGRRTDYQPTVEFYEDMLRKHNIENIKVIPCNRIKTEFDQFTLKRSLVDQYDIFLVDGRISGHVAHLLGKIFYSKRKVPTPVTLNNENLKERINKCILKTQMHIHSKGNDFIVQIGHSKMSVNDITENFKSILHKLCSNIPGGSNNIRALHVKTHKSIAIPVYMTLKTGNNIKQPLIAPKRPKLSKDVMGELSTRLNSNVTVQSTGEVIVQKLKNKED